MDAQTQLGAQDREMNKKENGNKKQVCLFVQYLSKSFF